MINRLRELAGLDMCTWRAAGAEGQWAALWTLLAVLGR